ncbi:MAG TPA: hypothetical protein VEH82_03740 [Acidimicrobiales bacterium]|nr:hypothetical protein [Acidimicrobiales bacterium]
MPRRNLIPYLLLALLAVLAVVFAIVGALAAPTFAATAKLVAAPPSAASFVGV